jgi:hypothetical protein
MAGFSGSGATDSGTNFLELCLVDFFVHRGEQTCLWNLGTSYRRQALSVPDKTERANLISYLRTLR